MNNDGLLPESYSTPTAELKAFFQHGVGQREQQLIGTPPAIMSKVANEDSFVRPRSQFLKLPKLSAVVS
jgi:hypothetical protein